MNDNSRDYGRYPTFKPVKNVPLGAGADGSLDYGKYPTFAPVKCRSRKTVPAGVLRPDEISGTYEHAIIAPVFGSKYLRYQIGSVTFMDTLADMGQDAWDVSEAGDGSVMAWVRPSGTLYDLFIGGEGRIRAGKSCQDLFSGYVNAREISFGGALDTGAVENMQAMFEGCGSLRKLDLRGVETGKVWNMILMFSGCHSLTALDVSGFDTSRVEDMKWMFSGCKSLTGLDLRGFHTGRVADMLRMFDGCEALQELKLGEGFVTEQADTKDMFHDCPAKLPEKKPAVPKREKTPAGVLRGDKPDVYHAEKYPVFGSGYLRDQIRTVSFVDTLEDMPGDAWDVSEEKDDSVMAWVRPNGELYDLYVGGWGRIRAGESCAGMFSGYVNAKEISFGEVLDTGCTQNMRKMFFECGALAELDLSGFNTGKVRDMSWMFHQCRSLKKLDLRGFNTKNVRGMAAMFNYCESLTSLDLSGFDTYGVQNMGMMFGQCYSLTDLKLGERFVPMVADTTNMYLKCPVIKLREDKPSNFEDPSKDPVFGSKYQRGQIKSVTFVDNQVDRSWDAWDVSAGKNCLVLAWVRPNGELYDLYIGGKGKIYAGESCAGMFSGYVNAEKITFGGALDTSNVRNMASMFHGCESLTGLDLSGFDTSGVTVMRDMFRNCRSLYELDLSSINTSKVQDLCRMFSGCGSLTKLDLSGFDTARALTMASMFCDCSSLNQLKLGKGFVTKQADTMDMYKNCPAGEKKTSRKKPAGVLRSDEGPSFGSADKYPVFGSKYQRWKIGTVTFVDNLKDMPKDAWDVSEEGDGSVKAWVKPRNWQYDLYIGGWGRVRTGKSCKGMFAGYTGVSRFSFGDALDTGATENMNGMFKDCRALRTLDLSSFRTGSVVNMGEMFSNCTALSSLNLKGFDTSRVQAMYWMFHGCSNLNGLNISHFDTSSLQNMDGMFYGCKSLNDISRPYEFVPAGASTKEMYKDCPADARPKFSGLRKLFGK